ncbi:MAG TPA: hypothetical protein VLV78_17360 [Thermoanaerobaculia bacterium]|nr:hypothetical protein [Thermoanaerobaculia bacterium]
MLAILASLLIFSAAATPAPSPFEAAAVAAANYDFVRAADLYRAGAANDPDPKRRDLAAIRLANIDWRIRHDAATAERDLQLVREDGEEWANAWTERARMAAELRSDFTAERELAARAMALATRPLDRSRAALVYASAIIEPMMRARLEGRCTSDPDSLAVAAKEMNAIVQVAGYSPVVARAQLDIALLSNEGPGALTAWRGYYGPTSQSSLLAVPDTTLATQLPAWGGVDAPAAQRRAVGLALADSRFFTEAMLVLRDPCAKQPLAADDARINDVVAYAMTIRDVAAATDEYYRKVALRQAKPEDLRTLINSAGRSLWEKLSFEGQRPRYSEEAAQKEVDRRFGAVVKLGTTQGIFDLHYGHRVIEEERQVSQYGRTASLRFVSLDGIVSNGFAAWTLEGRGGDGGWSDGGIVQIRPLYAMGPGMAWVLSTNPAFRKQQDELIADESRHDDERVALDPDQMPPGVVMRLDRQYRDGVLDQLRGRGLTGDALREAFVDRVTRDVFASSIWAHEGRHAIDKKYDQLKSSPELEFRAKLSEVELSPAPRKAAESIGGKLPATSPHGVANRRIGKALSAWMRAHQAEISGVDPSRPMLSQVDKLSDDQLREAFRSFDPLAKP